jgi:heme-degrading monooxygenase HmoA
VNRVCAPHRPNRTCRAGVLRPALAARLIGRSGIVIGLTRSLLYVRTKPGRREELVAAFERLGILAVASDQPGFLGAELAVAVDDDDAVLITGFWASPEHYEAWLANPIRGELLDQVAQLLVSEPETRLYHVVESIS